MHSGLKFFENDPDSVCVHHFSRLYAPPSPPRCPPPLLHQDDTFEDSSIFSVGSMGSAATNGGHGRVPSSPSTLGAADQSDDEEEDDELRGRWGNDGVVVGGGEKHDSQQGHHVSKIMHGGMVSYEVDERVNV